MNYSIVILNRYPQLARDLLSSIQRTHYSLPSVVVVCDRHNERFDYPNIHTIYDNHGFFVFARNANRGIDAKPTSDIVLCNDDMSCIQKDFFHSLAKIAYNYDKCGILSPLIDGGVGNELQQYPTNGLWPPDHQEIGIGGTGIDAIPVCFPCVYIKRELINKIGTLDEKAVGYGFDDNDYCIRARKAGYLTMITRRLYIRHGAGGCALNRGVNWSISFAKEPSCKSNQEYFVKKHSS